MLLGEILSVHVAPGNRIIGIDGQRGIPNLNRQSILQIQKTDLANVLQFTTRLTNLSLLVPRIPTGPPPKHRKRPRANLAFFIEIRFGLHSSHVLKLN